MFAEMGCKQSKEALRKLELVLVAEFKYRKLCHL